MSANLIGKISESANTEIVGGGNHPEVLKAQFELYSSNPNSGCQLMAAAIREVLDNLMGVKLQNPQAKSKPNAGSHLGFGS
jgi:hypothetical protein